MEYSIILLDNSDRSRNGDYIPSRWEAQIDSTYLISTTKLSQNQESGIGLITYAGKQPQVLLTPTNEDTKIQASLYGVKQQGSLEFKNGLSIAYLALKHRKNAHARQRITVFVASPVSEDEATLVKFAKQLKKNSVAVDLINLGEQDQEHLQKLEKFIETVNQGDNSHFLNVQPGLGRMEDKLLGTPFVGADNSANIGGGEAAAQGGDNQDVGAINNQFAEWGGINPQEDPEMAEIMRQSLLTNAEEQRRRSPEEEQADKAAAAATTTTENKSEQKMDEEEQKQDKKEETQEEELIRRAQEITINDEDRPLLDGKNDESGVQDEDFMNELLDTIQGLDKDDEDIKQALLKKDDNDDNNNNKDKKDKQ